MARAPIKGDTLRWAREIAQVEREELAAAAGTSPARIDEFEEGVTKPTFRQLTLIAGKLDRPLGFFFAVVPEMADVPQAADFRGQAERRPSASVVREMKRAEQHRDTVLDLSGVPSPPARIGEITFANAGKRAATLRHSLGLTDAFTPPESQQNQVFNFWRGLLEAHGYLVFQTTRIPLEAFRGLSIHHELLPVIIVNGADSANGRTFTLFHEVAHLANRTSGLCLLDDDISEEAVANAFAARFLMPRQALRDFLMSRAISNDAVVAVAARFKVSPLAAAVRLRSLDLISEEDLAEVRRESDENWERNRERQRQSDGFVPAWRLRYRDLGPAYIGTVAHAIEDGRLDILDATYLLNARVPMVEQLISEYHRTGGEE